MGTGWWKDGVNVLVEGCTSAMPECMIQVTKSNIRHLVGSK